jgi:hypothetical protein
MILTAVIVQIYIGEKNAVFWDVGLVRTDVSEERVSSQFRVEKIRNEAVIVQIDIEEMPSSGMWRRVGIVRTDVSEERVASIYRVETSANAAVFVRIYIRRMPSSGMWVLYEQTFRRNVSPPSSG